MMLYPDRYDRNPVNEMPNNGFVCEGKVQDKAGESVHCQRKPIWVVHSNYHQIGNEKICTESFYCDECFFRTFKPGMSDVRGITFRELRADEKVKTGLSQ